MFFILPILAPNRPATKELFRPLDDLLDTQDDMSPHLRFVLYHELLRPVLESRTEAICDVVEAGDEKLFRLSDAKLVGELLAKARRMASSSKLPTSLEERFIRQALEPPLQSVRREDVVTDDNPTRLGDENMDAGVHDGPTPDAAESQSSTATTTSTSSTSTLLEVSTPITPPSIYDTVASGSSTTDDNIRDLLRIRVALNFMQQSYVAPHISTKIEQILSSQISPVDFKPLDEHLQHLAVLRAEAVAARSASDYSRKRATDDQDADARETRAEKKRRLEEEEKKKKAGQSRAVRDLQKVNTSGMKKMSDFFSQVASKKKG
jgi:ribosomal protein L12E/L44/L45/RPP1/RPP2